MRYFLLLCCYILSLPSSSVSQVPISYTLKQGRVFAVSQTAPQGKELNLPFRSPVTAFSWAPKAPNRLLAGTQGTLYFSLDAGISWRQAIIHSIGFTPVKLAVSQKNPFKIFCAGVTHDGARTEVWLSMDGGVAWNLLGVTSQLTDVITLDPDNTVTPVSGLQTDYPARKMRLPDAHSATSTQNCNIVWSEPVLLSDTSVDSFTPWIATSGDDTIHVTWIGGGKTLLPYRRSTDGGATFEPVRDLITDSASYSAGAHTPRVLAEGSKVYIFSVPKRMSMPAEVMTLNMSNDAGTTWEPMRIVTNDLPGLVDFAAMHGDTILVTYLVTTSGKSVISTNGGLTWKSGEEYNDSWPRFTITNGTIHLLKWINPPGSPAAEVLYLRSTDAGESWKDSSIISSDDSIYSDVYAITANERNSVTELWTAWRDVKYGHFGLLGADILGRSNIDNEGFMGEQIMSEEPRLTEPNLSSKGMTRGLATWLEVIPGESLHVGARATCSSLFNFCSITDLTPDKYTGAPGKIIATSHAVHVVWEQLDPDRKFHIYYRKGEFQSTTAQLSVGNSASLFDTTEVTTKRNLKINAHNPGLDSTHIGTVISDNGEFFVQPDSLTIAPGLSDSVTVTFSPHTAGPKSGKIIFYHNGPTSPDVVSVSGIAKWHEQSVGYMGGMWNLVSTPSHPSQKIVLLSLFAFDHGYYAADSMVVGAGYWAKPDSAIGFEGIPVYIDTVNVKKGWNLVGAMTEPIPATSLTTTPLNNLASSFYNYNGISYTAADSLKPGAAYWVKMKEDGALILIDPARVNSMHHK